MIFYKNSTSSFFDVFGEKTKISFDFHRKIVRIHTKFSHEKIMTDFLSQVQEAEQKAATLVEKATSRKQTALRKYRSDLEEEQKVTEGKEQEKMKAEVQSARTEARSSYEAQIKSADGEAKNLEIERGSQSATLLPEATKFLLELL